jgi:RNA polymerase sigma-70 factor (ECF subfamily)
MPQMPASRDDAEKRIQHHHRQAEEHLAAAREEEARRELTLATTLAVQTYGNELRGWFAHKVRDPALAGDLFQEFCAWLWRGLGHFRWESSLRTWLYKLAFHVLCHHARSLRREPEGGGADVLEPGPVDLLSLGVEMSTVGTRLDKRQKLMESLQQLAEGDRQLILMRQVEGEEGSWKDLALAWNGHKPLSPADLDGEAARLRQRFHRAMETLRTIAQQKGLDL